MLQSDLKYFFITIFYVYLKVRYAQSQHVVYGALLLRMS